MFVNGLTPASMYSECVGTCVHPNDLSLCFSPPTMQFEDDKSAWATQWHAHQGALCPPCVKIRLTYHSVLQLRHLTVWTALFVNRKCQMWLCNICSSFCYTNIWVRIWMLWCKENVTGFRNLLEHLLRQLSWRLWCQDKRCNLSSLKTVLFVMNVR